jgi:ribonuclease HI
MTRKQIFTDGSAYWRDGSAGYGVIFVEGDNVGRVVWDALPVGTSVQQAEQWAVIVALKMTPRSAPLMIYSDSNYVVETMNSWARIWLTNTLRLYGLSVFPNDDLHTILHLYKKLRLTEDVILYNANDEPIANQTEWNLLWNLYLDRDILFEWIPGHKKEYPWNQFADSAAGLGREKCIQINNLR